MALIRGVVFDLDDTLYLERDYVRSGFEYIARLISETTDLSQELLFHTLMEIFASGKHGKVFDELLIRYPEISFFFQVSDLVEAYRAHKPRIELLPGALMMLHRLKENKRLMAILSDGNVVSQRAKLDVLGLYGITDCIVLTDEWGKDFWKPHPRGFEEIARRLCFPPHELVYIADNPTKDFIAPNRLGWHTIRLRIPGQLHFATEPLIPEAAPENECSGFEEIMDLLEV